MNRAPRRVADSTDRTGPDRAVIDIGSNTVRLVMYGGSLRAPEALFNEKVSAKLGRDLAETGLIPDKAAALALTALRRFAAIVEQLRVPQVDVVATAAIRDATNGPEMLAAIRSIGLDARLLSGDEEARAAASGVIAAFPDAAGVVADLGGGSLELVAISDGQDHHGESLPLGTLRLGALREKGAEAFNRAIARAFDKAGWANDHADVLYMVGGTWRAFARYAMIASDHPLHDPHGLRITAAQADKMAKKLLNADPARLREGDGISGTRAAALPDAAALLRAMLANLEPRELVFSSWGLREGLLYQRLSDTEKRQDPLLAGMTQFTAPRGASLAQAMMIAGWTAPVVKGATAASERLRLAATLLAIAASRVEPNIRTRHMLDWALEKRWLGLEMSDRALIAAALLGSCGKPALPADLLSVAPEAQLREAIGWGLAVRLCRRLGPGPKGKVADCTLSIEGDSIVLTAGPAGADLIGESVRGDLDRLAQWLGLVPDIRLAVAS